MTISSTCNPTNIWAVVLAAGDGTRLRSLTTAADGESTPKQYCSLFGGPSLLEDALQRGTRVADPGHVAAIVASHHERHWRGALDGLHPRNVVVQPQNRGTAHGVLLATLAVLSRDPSAVLLFLPADHDVIDETRLSDAIHSAVAATVADPSAVVLVGIEPDEADPELGYVVPGSARGLARTVVKFVEKPPRAEAAQLLAAGAVWNSFIFAASGESLLDLYRMRLAKVVTRMTAAVEAGDEAALADLYASLDAVDFSRDILAHSTDALRIVTARACGWSDLGTPHRVSEAARRARSTPTRRPHAATPSYPAMSLTSMLSRQRLPA
ncbi:MAG: sugar phosphate nucleotidyltransferase [Betaproteobacteria bacterium]|jgi:mannose-1-phosphate guanylyltransferase